MQRTCLPFGTSVDRFLKKACRNTSAIVFAIEQRECHFHETRWDIDRWLIGRGGFRQRIQSSDL